MGNPRQPSLSGADGRKHYPRCLEGARACPPEDCGGIPGYEHLLRVLLGQNHQDDEELREWVGNFQPNAFSVTKVNSLLARLTPPLHA